MGMLYSDCEVAVLLDQDGPGPAGSGLHCQKEACVILGGMPPSNNVALAQLLYQKPSRSVRPSDHCSQL